MKKVLCLVGIHKWCGWYETVGGFMHRLCLRCGRFEGRRYID